MGTALKSRERKKERKRERERKEARKERGEGGRGEGTVYNVATDEEISIIDLVYLCAEKLDIKNPKIIFKGYRESDPKRRILNTDKIRKLTEWKPKITLDKGIEECIIELNKQGGK